MDGFPFKPVLLRQPHHTCLLAWGAAAVSDGQWCSVFGLSCVSFCQLRAFKKKIKKKRRGSSTRPDFPMSLVSPVKMLMVIRGFFYSPLHLWIVSGR